MPAEDVTQLSDEDCPARPLSGVDPKPKPVPKNKPKEKAAPKSKGKAAPKPKTAMKVLPLKRPAAAEAEAEAGGGPSKETADPEQASEALPNRKPALKKPAAAPAAPRAYKSRYPDGKWEIKLKGAGEQMTAGRSIHAQLSNCSCPSVFHVLPLSHVLPPAFVLEVKVKPTSGVTESVLEEIAVHGLQVANAELFDVKCTQTHTETAVVNLWPRAI